LFGFFFLFSFFFSDLCFPQLGSLFKTRGDGFRNQKDCVFHLIGSLTKIQKAGPQDGLTDRVAEGLQRCHDRAVLFSGDRRFLNLVVEGFRLVIQTRAQETSRLPPVQALRTLLALLVNPSGDLLGAVLVLGVLKDYVSIPAFRKDMLLTEESCSQWTITLTNFLGSTHWELRDSALEVVGAFCLQVFIDLFVFCLFFQNPELKRALE